MTSFAAGVDDVVDDVDGTAVNSRHRDVAKTRGDWSAADCLSTQWTRH